ncbi:MAG: DnaA regulatory inactivator Hda [Porticoccaceae bacterium]|nr:DnaA regulatory inactivator Hda [Porticoccaceae bacterium]
MKHPQIPLPFRLQEAFNFDNFIAADNQLITQSLQTLDQPFVFLWGDEGTGKTHLLQATCQLQTQLGTTASYLPFKELITLSSDILDGMANVDLICIDDIHLAFGNAEWEEALFNLFNQIKQASGRLVVSSTLSPQQSSIQLNDLKSRLNSGLALNLASLNDESTIQAMQARAFQLGLELNRDTANYILTRFPRNLSTLWNLLAQLDHASLAAQRKLTIPFVKSTLL